METHNLFLKYHCRLLIAPPNAGSDTTIVLALSRHLGLFLCQVRVKGKLAFGGGFGVHAETEVSEDSSLVFLLLANGGFEMDETVLSAFSTCKGSYSLSSPTETEVVDAAVVA